MCYQQDKGRGKESYRKVLCKLQEGCGGTALNGKSFKTGAGAGKEAAHKRGGAGASPSILPRPRTHRSNSRKCAGSTPSSCSCPPARRSQSGGARASSTARCARTSSLPARRVTSERVPSASSLRDGTVTACPRPDRRRPRLSRPAPTCPGPAGAARPAPPSAAAAPPPPGRRPSALRRRRSAPCAGRHSAPHPARRQMLRRGWQSVPCRRAATVTESTGTALAARAVTGPGAPRDPRCAGRGAFPAPLRGRGQHGAPPMSAGGAGLAPPPAGNRREGGGPMGRGLSRAEGGCRRQCAPYRLPLRPTACGSGRGSFPHTMAAPSHGGHSRTSRPFPHLGAIPSHRGRSLTPGRSRRTPERSALVRGPAFRAAPAVCTCRGAAGPQGRKRGGLQPPASPCSAGKAKLLHG